jgi:hypothetical protein
MKVQRISPASILKNQQQSIEAVKLISAPQIQNSPALQQRKHRRSTHDGQKKNRAERNDILGAQREPQ